MRLEVDMKAAVFIFCGLLVIALSVPAFAKGAAVAKKQQNPAAYAAGKVYGVGAGLADRTAGLLTSCLKNTFSFFNPCLDVVKGCTTMVTSPIDKSLDYAEGVVSKKLMSGKPAKAQRTK
jgi:hypothetical protein